MRVIIEEDDGEMTTYMDVLLSEQDLRNVIDGKGAECSFVGSFFGEKNLSFFIRKDPQNA